LPGVQSFLRRQLWVLSRRRELGECSEHCQCGAGSVLGRHRARGRGRSRSAVLGSRKCRCQQRRRQPPLGDGSR